MEEGLKSFKKGHVLVLPYPGQGHLNPMVQFSRRLIARGLKATLVTSLYITKSMGFGSSIGSVQIETISDGFDEGGFQQASSIDHYLSQLKQDGSRTLHELIEKYKNTPDPFSCLIYEPFLPWALDVAKEHGLFGATFFTQPCAVDYIYYCIQNKLLRLPLDTTPVSIPGLPMKLELRDLPSFVQVPEAYPAYFALVVDQFSNTDKADVILINTFYHLEKEVVDTMSKIFSVMTIGPTVPSKYLDKRLPNDDDYGLDLFSVHASISLDWIGNKPPNSVIYVAFGSMVDLSLEQMVELAWGFKNSNFYFLWVIRDSELAKLPTTFVKELGDKGLVVNWSPQMEILSKEAVACFFSHCGWNSTIEALSLGVPIVGMPQWTDQPPNAKLVEDVWKVGIRVKVDEASGIVPKEEVERCVREVIEGKNCQEMRKNAAKWRKLALMAVSEGGTSDVDIDLFVSKFTKYNFRS